MLIGMMLALLPVLAPALLPVAFLGLLKFSGFGILALACLLFLANRGQSKAQKIAPQPEHLAAETPAELAQEASPSPAPSALEKEFAKTPMRFAPYDGGQRQPASPPIWSAQVLDEIEWRRFEAVVERLFQHLGFDTKSQSHGADGGVDVWLYSRAQAGQLLSLVQCKHWHKQRVGVSAVRQLRGVMASHSVERGQFVSSSGFTNDAQIFAKENGISLMDASALLKRIATCTPEQQTDLLQVAHEGEYWRPTCASCGVKLVERKPRKGGVPFWGCRHYPSCKNTLPMRAR